MISKSFLKSSIIFTVAGALPMAASLLLLPFYTNFFNAQQYVSLNFYITISLLFQILFSYSIESYFGVKYTQLSSEFEEQKRFVGTVANLLLLIGLGLTLFYIVVGPFIFPLIFTVKDDVSFWPFGLASVLTAFFNSYFKASTNALIYFKKSGTFLAFNIINFLATIGISVWGLYAFPNSLVGPIAGRFFSGVIIFFLGLYIFKSNSIWVLDKKFLHDLQKFCTPYICFVLFYWVLGFIDRFFLKNIVSAEELSAYDLLLKCLFGIEFVQNALNAIIFPRVFAIWAADKKNETTPESNRYFNVSTALNVLILISFCIFIPIMIRTFVNKDSYFQSFTFIGIVSAGYITRGIINYYLSTILFTKKTTLLIKIFGYSSIIQIGATIVLANYFGIVGAIFAGLLTKLAQVFLSYYLSRNIFTYNTNFMKIYGIPFLFLICNAVCFFVFPQYNLMVYLGQMLLFGIMFYIIFKNEIKIVYAQFTKRS
jgi:O-antigen/teichoic acid export membrane protein